MEACGRDSLDDKKYSENAFQRNHCELSQVLQGEEIFWVEGGGVQRHRDL